MGAEEFVGHAEPIGHGVPGGEHGEQYRPFGQGVDALFEPVPHQTPPPQHKHVDIDVALMTGEYVPAGHGVGTSDVMLHQLPEGHARHDELDVPAKFK